MLCVIGHAPHSDEVMYRSYSDGERKWELKESDRQMLRDAGYKIIPEPSTLIIWSLLGALGMTIGWWRRKL